MVGDFGSTVSAMTDYTPDSPTIWDLIYRIEEGGIYEHWTGSHRLVIRGVDQGLFLVEISTNYVEGQHPQTDIYQQCDEHWIRQNYRKIGVVGQ